MRQGGASPHVGCGCLRVACLHEITDMKTIAYIIAGSFLLFSRAQAEAPAQTLQNLNLAYKGEAEASVFYRDCAQQAQRDGFPGVAKLFRAASVSESIHRDNHRHAIRSLGGVPAALPASKTNVKPTRDNLAESVADERQESRVMYPDYYRVAQKEQAPQAMRTFRFARDTERAHQKLFSRALDQLGKKPATDYFVCETCGMTTMDSVPAVCPVCRGSGMDYRKIE
jgi:rubrerythrin